MPAKRRRLVFDLYEQLVDPNPGKCQPVVGLGGIEGLPLASPGLVINPTQRQADAALTHAINTAASDGAVLLVYYVGHGRFPFGRMSQGDYNWDWHRNIFDECRGTLPMLDQGIAALVEDLDERGMLDDVSVVVWGEFGRTPKINSNAGRDHWPQVAGAMLAGGGMRTGQVIGSTNRYGEHVKDRPVHFREVFATLYHQMGIDVEHTQFNDLGGRPRYLVDDRKPMPELI